MDEPERELQLELERIQKMQERQAIQAVITAKQTRIANHQTNLHTDNQGTFKINEQAIKNCVAIFLKRCVSRASGGRSEAII
ncbi:MAG: hypothetical protein ACLS8G_14980 [Enterococcus faecalis]